MKKIVLVLLVGAMLFAMSACSQFGIDPTDAATVPVLENPYDPDATAGKMDSQFKDPEYPELPDHSYGIPKLRMQNMNWLSTVRVATVL